VFVERDVPVAMSDGVTLRADVYRPAAGGTLPVLVCRTAYGKRGQLFDRAMQETATEIAAGGYVVVVQDVRGRYASEGSYVWCYDTASRPQHERDGSDTIAWASELPGSDGRVGTWGNSYDGFTALCAIAARPRGLAAGFVSGVARKLQDETFGIFKPLYLNWTANMAADLDRRADPEFSARTAVDVERDWELAAGKWLWWLPFDELPDEPFGRLAQPLRSALPSQHVVDPWAFDRLDTPVEVPVCHMSGWWDYVSQGTVATFQTLTAHDDGTPHRLVLGPWSHGFGDGQSDVDYGPGADSTYAREVVRWYDERLRAETPDIEPGVLFYVLNLNQWRHARTWPPGGGEQLELFLRAGSDWTFPDAGSLSMEPPGVEDPHRYEFDPRDPVISLDTWRSRAVDHAPHDVRSDVLRFVTEPLGEDALVIGEPELVLWAASTAPDTDFVVRLLELREDGSAIALARAVVRARYREGYEREVFLEPGEPTRFNLRLSPIGVLLQAGTRLRLDVTSSDFPNFDRNHNTGRAFWSDPELVTANQTVFHDESHSSRLILPLSGDRDEIARSRRALAA
jgi:uncharacterized protein